MSIAEENAVCQAIYYTIVYKFTVVIEVQLECLNTKCVSLFTLKVNLISIITLSPLIKATAKQLKLANINKVDYVAMHCSACYRSFNFRIS